MKRDKKQQSDVFNAACAGKKRVLQRAEFRLSRHTENGLVLLLRGDEQSVCALFAGREFVFVEWPQKWMCEMVYKPSENYIERHLSLASLLRIYNITRGRIIVIGDLALRRHNSAARLKALDQALKLHYIYNAKWTALRSQSDRQ